MDAIFSQIGAFMESTGLQAQIKNVDINGLFSNPWFIVPFAALMLYLLYKKSWRNIVIIAILTGVWWFSGTPYMQSVIVGNELQIGKILPLVGGGAVIIGILGYLLFGGSD